MKKIWLIIGLVMSIFTFNNALFAQKFSDKTKTVHQAIKHAIIVIQKKYELQLGGIKEATDYFNNEKYKEVGLCLVAKKYLSRDEARKIILDVSNILLEHLNQEEVKPYLTVNPFTLDDIMIMITYQMRDKDKDYTQFQACGASCGELYFAYDSPNQKYRREYESYEEALKLNEQVGDISTPISISLIEHDTPKKRSWWSSLFG